MKKSLAAAVLCLPLLLTGCIIVDSDGEHNFHADWEDLEYKNRKLIANLETDATVEKIKNRMGVPDFSELHNRGGDKYQVLFYRTQRTRGDGVTTKDECTPLVFKNGLLVGWGDLAYQEI